MVFIILMCKMNCVKFYNYSIWTYTLFHYMQTEFKMCSKTTTLSAHVQRISTVLTTSQLIGFAPLLYHLVEDDHRTWTIISLYIALFLHYALNNILYYGSSQTSGRNGCVLIWLIYYAAEYVGLFVFGVYSAFCVLTWPRRGWPKYYVFVWPSCFIWSVSWYSFNPCYLLDRCSKTLRHNWSAYQFGRSNNDIWWRKK